MGVSDDYKEVYLYGNKTFSNYSGRGGKVISIDKPEVVAPGSNIVSCMNGRTGYAMKSGSSMATPIVTGAIALLLDKNPNLRPDDVKTVMRNTAKDLGYDRNKQGWGLIDIEGMIENCMPLQKNIV